MAKQKQVVFKQKPNHTGPVACNYGTIENTKGIAPKSGCVSDYILRLAHIMEYSYKTVKNKAQSQRSSTMII